MILKVEVRLFATFRNGRFKKTFMEFCNEVTPREILFGLGIELDDVAILLINGINGKFDTPLKDGDRISVFPPVGGG